MRQMLISQRLWRAEDIQELLLTERISVFSNNFYFSSLLTWRKMLTSFLYAKEEAINKKILFKLGIVMSNYAQDFLNKT